MLKLGHGEQVCGTRHNSNARSRTHSTVPCGRGLCDWPPCDHFFLAAVFVKYGHYAPGTSGVSRMLRQRIIISLAKRRNADLELIDGGFTDYLRQRHTAAFTIAFYCRFLRR